MNEPSDGSLIRHFLSGEQDAATNLYLRYARRLSEVARRQTPRALSVRVDPDDVVQSVFRTFFRRVRLGNYLIPQGEDLWKLLLVISLNKIRALGVFHRAAKRDIAHTVNFADGVSGSRLARPADQSALQALEITIEELLGGLPPSHAAIARFRIQGYDVAEISQKTARSKRTVERVLQEFRQKLGAIIHEELSGTDDDSANAHGT